MSSCKNCEKELEFLKEFCDENCRQKYREYDAYVHKKCEKCGEKFDWVDMNTEVMSQFCTDCLSLKKL